MKRYFLTGLILLLPFAVSVFLFLWILDLLTNPFLSLSKQLFQPLFYSFPSLATILSRLLIVFFLVGFTGLLGFFARRFIFSHWIHYLQTLFLKIPFLRVVYKLSKEVAQVTFNAEASFFKQTVLTPFPQENSWAIGLVTGSVPEALKKAEVDITVFVPTSPHPISGFLLFTTQKQIKPLDLSTEEAFKFILSCGSTPLKPGDSPCQNFASSSSQFKTPPAK